jgi:hypothetical protein
MSNQRRQNATATAFSGGMRADAKKSKVVFKNVLDTPFNIPWYEKMNSLRYDRGIRL